MKALKFDDSEYQVNGQHVAPKLYLTIKRLNQSALRVNTHEEYRYIAPILSKAKKALKKIAPDHEIVRKGYLRAKSLRYELHNKNNV